MIPTKTTYLIHLAPYTNEHPYPRTNNQTPCQDDSPSSTHVQLKKNENVRNIKNRKDDLMNFLV